MFSEKNTVTMQTCALFIQHVHGVLKKKCVCRNISDISFKCADHPEKTSV